MQEIPRAILLPAPSHLPQRASVRAIQSDSGSGIGEVLGRRASQGPAHAFLTLVDSRRDDTVEIKGKQFRFRPYNSRGAADGSAHETDPSRAASEAEPVSSEAGNDDIAIDVFEGFGAGARARNSSAFITTFIAQERLRQGLYNPQYEAASDAYRRAGGSPSPVGNQPRILSVAI